MRSPRSKPIRIAPASCVALASGDADWPAIAARRTRLIETTEGGEQRAHSVRNALRALATRVREDDWIMVHDAARPCFAAADLALLKRELSSIPSVGCSPCRWPTR